MKPPTTNACLLAGAISLAAALPASAAPRDVQIKSVDFETGVIELHNFGDTDESLQFWRWCSADEDEIQLYTAFGGLIGVTIEAGTSIFFYENDDAPGGGDADNINFAQMGGQWALPLDAADGAYGLNIYNPPVDFDDGNTMASYVQWSLDGVDNFFADERADEAQAGGVWADENDWVAVTADTKRIELNTDTPSLPTSSADWTVVGDEPDCPADCNDDNNLNILDFTCFQALFASADAAADCNGDGSLNILDFTCFQANFAAGCP